MPSSAERFGRQHPFLPSGWGPQARSDIPWNAPILEDVNPATGVVSRLTSRFGGDGGKGRVPGDGKDGEDGDPALAGESGVGIAGLDGAGVHGSGGVSGSSSALRNQLAKVRGQMISLRNLLDANGISSAAIAAGTSLLQRIQNMSGEGICNEDGTITITLTIPP